MSDTLALVQALVARREIKVSTHGLHELAADKILLEDIASGVAEAMVIEDYPSAFKGPSVLVLQRDGNGRPVHVVWGLEKGRSSPAVLVTPYRPSVARWSSDFLDRRSK